VMLKKGPSRLLPASRIALQGHACMHAPCRGLYLSIRLASEHMHAQLRLGWHPARCVWPWPVRRAGAWLMARAAPASPADKKLRPCFGFQRGECTKSADACEYAHRKMTPEEAERYNLRSRSSSQSSKGGGGKGRGRGKGKGRGSQQSCNNWARTGSCAYGDKCRFKHDKPAAPASESPRSPRESRGGRRRRSRSPRGSSTERSSSSS
jgi:hypothetical protein